MMIWKRPISVEAVTERNRDTFAEHMQITITEVGDDFLKAAMPITKHCLQPIGVMHGGVSCVFAETVGSNAANFAIDDDHYAVGLDINTNHIKSVRDGNVIAIAKPYHLGRSTQVWQIDIYHESGYLVSVNRLTMSVLPKRH